MPEHKKIEEFLREARKLFLEKDLYLLSVGANERALTHKFAEYLQLIVGDEWNVDCEYNRYGEEGKVIYVIQGVVGDEVRTDDLSAKTVYPDIILHKRGHDGPNLLVIEAKKDARRKDVENDKRKLDIIKHQYNYQFCCFLNFKTKQKDITIEILDF